jgi:hypothetical protein
LLLVNHDAVYVPQRATLGGVDVLVRIAAALLFAPGRFAPTAPICTLGRFHDPRTGIEGARIVCAVPEKFDIEKSSFLGLSIFNLMRNFSLVCRFGA